VLPYEGFFADVIRPPLICDLCAGEGLLFEIAVDFRLPS
jgi:hypothetical protein